MEAQKKKRLWKAATVLIPIAAIISVWFVADLGSYDSPQEVARAINGIAERPFGWALVPLGFAAGTLLFVPVNALIAGVTLSFDPLRGFLWAMTGGLLGAVFTYGAGLLFGSHVVELFDGPRVQKVVSRLRQAPFRTSLVLHLLPVGNFTAVNLLAGALRVPFGGFMLGTALGLLPGVLFFALLPKVVKEPKPLHLVAMVVALLAAVGLGLLIKRWAARGQRERVEA